MIYVTHTVALPVETGTTTAIKIDTLENKVFVFRGTLDQSVAVELSYDGGDNYVTHDFAPVTSAQTLDVWMPATHVRFAVTGTGGAAFVDIRGGN